VSSDDGGGMEGKESKKEISTVLFIHSTFEGLKKRRQRQGLSDNFLVRVFLD
jgi:hypothetical protein